MATILESRQKFFHAEVHDGIKDFSILDKKIKSIFQKILDTILWIPRKVYKGLHFLVGIPVYPAPYMYGLRKTKDKILDHLYDASGKGQLKIADFQAADGTWLKGAYFKASKETPVTMIYFNGNGENFAMNLTGLSDLANQLKVNLLVFNYRGTFPSQGSASKEGLILDGDAAYQYVRSLGIEDKHIILNGHSLGGGIASEVAAMHPDVNLCHERSFSKLSTEIHMLMGGGVFGKIISVLAQCLGWELNSVDNWNKVIGRKWVITSEQDGVIRKGARLFDHLDFSAGKEQAHILKDLPHDPRDYKPKVRAQAKRNFEIDMHNIALQDFDGAIDFFKQKIALIEES